MPTVAGAVLAVLAIAATSLVCKRRRSRALQLTPSLSGLPTTLRPPVYKQVTGDTSYQHAYYHRIPIQISAEPSHVRTMALELRSAPAALLKLSRSSGLLIAAPACLQRTH